MALRLSGLQKSSALPDGANAYPAYKTQSITTLCRMALALIRPTKPNPSPLFARWRWRLSGLRPTLCRI